MEITPLGIRPVKPSGAMSTMIMGAMAMIGMVCEVITHGITDRSMTRE